MSGTQLGRWTNNGVCRENEADHSLLPSFTATARTFVCLGDVHQPIVSLHSVWQQGPASFNITAKTDNVEQKGDNEISLASGHACPAQGLGCTKGRVLGDMQYAKGQWQPKENRRWVIALEESNAGPDGSGRADMGTLRIDETWVDSGAVNSGGGGTVNLGWRRNGRLSDTDQGVGMQSLVTADKLVREAENSKFISA
ncbi:uncharacterized protein LACBIDRAFT_331298 [Laccaria bicolor S238N-H82]|uniref:Predicted protein n=1 Tax=Laccaria bicolor (strain S238N-H82 / ATCC MYA-4686) TaxID=486041 RepID=B0DP23_LACBS|nr:uncharacterized protein LACBIDRAFT_331298 [Laccaria bicolor S238N-H82]EDR03535.1 predicted protein [Laccaria bicolor S238N-H82]|eukprot:XP_001885683.1 predicted protein [Laccaria bicolor S238N-H82]